MSGRVAWVIGGGSGIGQGAAEALARSADKIVVSGRRETELTRTVAALTAAGGNGLALPVDVRDTAAVDAAAEVIRAEHGPIAVLVYSAGTNVPNRFWRDTTVDAFERVVDVNLTGAVRAVSAVLPGMRERREGLVVLVSSWAGWRFAPAAGAGYSTSKTAMGALAETINAQERLHGIRATHFCPGEVATEILGTRPNPPTRDELELMLTAADVGSAIRWIAELPPRVCVNEIVFTPTPNASYA